MHGGESATMACHSAVRKIETRRGDDAAASRTLAHEQSCFDAGNSQRTQTNVFHATPGWASHLTGTDCASRPPDGLTRRRRVGGQRMEEIGSHTSFTELKRPADFPQSSSPPLTQEANASELAASFCLIHGDDELFPVVLTFQGICGPSGGRVLRLFGLGRDPCTCSFSNMYTSRRGKCLMPRTAGRAKPRCVEERRRAADSGGHLLFF